MSINDGDYEMVDQLYKTFKTNLKVENQEGTFRISLPPNESLILKIK